MIVEIDVRRATEVGFDDDPPEIVLPELDANVRELGGWSR
jgi:hypothetical protein